MHGIRETVRDSQATMGDSERHVATPWDETYSERQQATIGDSERKPTTTADSKRHAANQ